MANHGRFSRPQRDYLLHDSAEHARSYRNELRAALKAYPSGNRGEMKRRLYSETASGFWSASMELRLYGVLSGLGSVEVHPTIQGMESHPDYRVSTSETGLFVEATVALDSDEDREQHQRLVHLLDAIDSIFLPFGVWVDPVTDLAPDLDDDAVIGFLRQELESLESSQVEKGSLLTFRKRTGAGVTEIDFEVWPREEAQTLVEAWGPTAAQELTTHETIRRRVQHKATKYGELGAPFVIAIWPRLQFPAVEESVMRGLYGTVTLVYSKQDMTLKEVVRQPDGAFNLRVGEQVLNQQVSAVAVHLERLMGHGWERYWLLYHNPFALRPLSTSVFNTIPQLVFERTPGGFSGHWLDGVDPWESMFR